VIFKLSAQQIVYPLGKVFTNRLFALVSLFVFAIFLLCSCAIPFKEFKPSSFSYQNNANISQKIHVSYVYDIQRATNNRRYAKKEYGSGYSAISLRIKNISDQPIIVDQSNFKIFSSGKEIPYVTSEQYASLIKQRTGVHLLHGLWGPWGFHANGEGDKNESGKSEFIYLPIGLAVGLTNFIIA
jgi:hypothetical protein